MKMRGGPFQLEMLGIRVLSQGIEVYIVIVYTQPQKQNHQKLKENVSVPWLLLAVTHLIRESKYSAEVRIYQAVILVGMRSCVFTIQKFQLLTERAKYPTRARLIVFEASRASNLSASWNLKFFLG